MTKQFLSFAALALVSLISLAFLFMNSAFVGWPLLISCLLYFYYTLFFLFSYPAAELKIKRIIISPLIIPLIPIIFVNLMYFASASSFSVRFFAVSLGLYLIPSIILPFRHKKVFSAVDIIILLLPMLAVLLKVGYFNINNDATFIDFKPIYIGYVIFLLLAFLGLKEIDIHLNFRINRKMILTTLGLTLLLILIDIGFGFFFKSLSLLKPVWDKNTILVIIYSFFTAALTEEFYFRGLFFNYLQQILKDNYWIPLFLSSAVFALTHIGATPVFILLAFLAGLFYGWIYLKTQNLYCAVLGHALTNIVWKLFFVIKA